MAPSVKTKPMQFRLPFVALQFIEKESIASGRSKTQVVVDAIECLRRRKMMDQLKDEYAEMAVYDSRIAEEDMGAGSEIPEW